MPVPDPNTRAHLEWLGFIPPNGLVVSAPALVKAGAILNRQDAEGQHRLADCLREREFDSGRDPEPCLSDFREFASAVLGWGFSSRGYAGTEESPIPAELELPLPDYGETLRPNFAVRERDPRDGEVPWQLLVQILDVGQDFDAPAGGSAGGGFEASPHGRAERPLRGTGVAAGLLFNGVALRLFGDLTIAAFFAEAKPRQREAKRREFADAVVNGDAVRYLSWLEEQRDGNPPLAPFHWEIEFPEVFDRENSGFDEFVGNPPFAGKNALAGGNVAHYPDWLKAVYEESHGNADLVAHFYRRAFNLVRSGGALGLIATNTIAQGDTLSTGLRWICEPGGEIYLAALMVQNNEGLTKTCNRFHDPYEDNAEIARLRELHAGMDRAVLDAYGWVDIPTDCDFILDYEIDEAAWGRKKKPYRYGWPDAVRDEVLARLLALNAERAAEEARSGETSQATRRKVKPEPARSQYRRVPVTRPDLRAAEPRPLWPLPSMNELPSERESTAKEGDLDRCRNLLACGVSSTPGTVCPRVNPPLGETPIEARIENLELIQEMVNRLASDSFRTRGWTVDSPPRVGLGRVVTFTDVQHLDAVPDSPDDVSTIRGCGLIRTSRSRP